MTDTKNLADECARLAKWLCRAETILPMEGSDCQHIDQTDDVRRALENAASALRARAAPPPDSWRDGFSAGQAARAKQDVEIARTLVIDADGPIGNDQITTAIAKSGAL